MSDDNKVVSIQNARIKKQERLFEDLFPHGTWEHYCTGLNGCGRWVHMSPGQTCPLCKATDNDGGAA